MATFMTTRKTLVSLIGACLLASGGLVTAEVAEIYASVSVASAQTIESRARAKVTDSLNDDMRADVDYKRGNASAAERATSATGGSGTYAASTSGTTIATSCSHMLCSGTACQY
jgi:hypothetical protein